MEPAVRSVESCVHSDVNNALSFVDPRSCASQGEQERTQGYLKEFIPPTCPKLVLPTDAEYVANSVIVNMWLGDRL